ncbi:MAG: UDP-N-acetylmuramate--L-alanine ligase, partial [Bacteroidetes bacterium]|nr:UDP-N-acetylmuramate--L-alanine ligase [Bacteroidota bacterium]
MSDLHRIYFLGIGGIGMSSLARYFHAKGVKVSGYDKTPTALTNRLQSEGIDIHFEDDITKIPDDIDLVIYTPAIPVELNEFRHIKKSGIKIKKRSEVLGKLTQNKKAIAVAGTHGKTTVSTLIAYLLKQSEVDCNALLGGIAKNYDSNFLISEKSDWMVVEADEFDKSFLQLHPLIEVITSADADHLDIYSNINNLKNSFGKFAAQIRKDGTIIIKKGVEINLGQVPDCRIFEYALDEQTDFFADNIRLKNEFYEFDFVTPEETIKNIVLGIPGLINVENAV